MDDPSIEKINLARVESCKVCGTGANKQSVSDPIEEICGRDGKRVFAFTPEKLANLDLHVIERHLSEVGLTKKLSTRLGLTFTDNKGIKGSVFKTGVAVIEGADSRERARSLYESLTKIKIE